MLLAVDSSIWVHTIDPKNGRLPGPIVDVRRTLGLISGNLGRHANSEFVTDKTRTAPTVRTGVSRHHTHGPERGHFRPLAPERITSHHRMLVDGGPGDAEHASLSTASSKSRRTVPPPLSDHHAGAVRLSERGGDGIGDESGECVWGDVVDDGGVLGDDPGVLAVTGESPHDMDVVAA